MPGSFINSRLLAGIVSIEPAESRRDKLPASRSLQLYILCTPEP